MFKKGGIKVTPGTKLCFYSDPDGLQLANEVTFGQDLKEAMEPIRLSTGKVWAQVVQSKDVDILGDDQIVTDPKIQFAVFQVPKEWTVVCWLTENITSSLLKDGAVKSTTFALLVFEKMMNAILKFYSKANAPGLIKSVIIRLISRLVIKLRYLYQQMELANVLKPESAKQPHLARLFISQEFIKNLIDDA